MALDKNSLEMKNSLNNDNSSIIFENDDSDVNRFFRMDAPFQLTLEYCDGSEKDNYINIVTLSPKKSVLYQETLSEKNWFYTKSVPHFHDFYEFIIVLEGSLTLQIEGNDYQYHAGSCYLINRGICHLEKYSSRCKVLFIGISVDFIEQLFKSDDNTFFHTEKEFYKSNIYEFIQDDIKNPGKKSYLDFIPAYQNTTTATKLHSLAEELIKDLLFPTFGTYYLIMGRLCAFLAYLSASQNYLCTTVCIDNSSDYLIFSRVTRLLEESDGRMSRTELEKVLNYSGGHLNRIINKYTGMCLYDYGMSFCLKKAAKYLEETNDSIQTIAAKLHFTNRTHFYNQFKAKYGVTPKEYRKLQLRNL